MPQHYPSPEESVPVQKLLADRTVVTQHTFLEGAVRCSESAVDRCAQCRHLGEIQEEMEHFINSAARQYRTTHHGLGCGLKNKVFYALDSVDWEDMVGMFGVNDTDRSKTEVLVKVDSRENRLFSVDLSNRSVYDSEEFFAFAWGRNEENSEHLQNPSAKNKNHKNYYSVTDIVYNADRKKNNSDKNYAEFPGTKNGDTDPLIKEDNDFKINEVISNQKTDFIKEVSRLDLLSLEEDSSDCLVFVYTKWCGYCHVVLRKLEVVSRLSLSPRLSFVKVDSDINNRLRGSKISAERVPSIYLLQRGTPWPIQMVFGSKPVSVRNIVSFITKHIPEIRFNDSYGTAAPFPSPSVPCRPWFPMDKPPPQKPSRSEKLAYFEQTAMDLLLEELENSKKSAEAEKEAAAQRLSDEISLNRGTMCRGSQNMFKLMAVNSPISPYDRAPVIVNLINDLYHWRCILNSPEDGGDALWDFVGSACSRSTWSNLCCKYLLTASHIANHYHFTPPEILGILQAKVRKADQQFLLTARAAAKSGSDPPKHEVADHEWFYMRSCYNVDCELAFFLKSLCSKHCRMTCRVINKLYF